MRAALGLVLLLPSTAAGQDSVGAGTRLGLTIGLTRTDRRDDNVSPMRYGGYGRATEASYSYRWPRWHLSLRGGQSGSTLSSALTVGSEPQEDNEEVWIEAELLRGTRWQIGALASGWVTDVTHTYAGPLGYPVSFSFYYTSIAPAVGWERRGERSALAARLAIPAVAWVRRPYSDDRVGTAANQNARLETIAHFQSVDLRASWMVRLGRRGDFLLEYRLVGQRYERDAPFRSLSGTLNGGFTARIGRLP